MKVKNETLKYHPDKTNFFLEEKKKNVWQWSLDCFWLIFGSFKVLHEVDFCTNTFIIQIIHYIFEYEIIVDIGTSNTPSYKDFILFLKVNALGFNPDSSVMAAINQDSTL